jgi:hypothetical protein
MMKLSTLRSRISLPIAAIASLALSHVAAPAQAITITPTDDGETLVNTILGPGITIIPGSISYNGASGASGTFTDGLASGLGIESGILLTTGQAADAVGPNNNGDEAEVAGSGIILNDTSTQNFFPGDPDLDTLVPGSSTQDATTLSFSFETLGGDLFFRYVFASEEYINFEGSEFNDVFGFFLDGVNIALIPGTTTPVAINNVNSTTNSSLFRKNINPAVFDIEYDGFTTVFTAQALDIGAGVHTIKLAIADVFDRRLDSAVFIEAGTFSDKPPVKDVPEPTGTAALILIGALVGTGIVRRSAVSMA